MEKVPYNLYINYEELSSLFDASQSREENFVRCGLASIELTTHLLGSFIKQPDSFDADKIADLVKGVETQFRLLTTYASPFEEGNYKERYSKNIHNLKLLDESYADAIDRITKLYFHFSKRIKVGLDNQMNSIRTHFGLSRMTPEIAVVLNNKGEFRLPDLDKLSKPEYFNSEDEIFMRTHQISEYWFNIAIGELRSIEMFFQTAETDSDEIKKHFKAAYEILVYLADHVLILEHMVLSDYHPLRVALRGASGGQSQQAHEIFGVARKVYGDFLRLLEMKDKKIVEVLENPRRDAKLLSIVNNFSKLERSLKNFFFQHYNLSSGTIGSQSFGSIGFDLVQLTAKFVNPLFKEIDQAKYDFTLKTNFQYGDSSGVLILREENFNPQLEKKRITNDHQVIDKAIGHYFEAISALDMERWVQLFAENGYIEDPVGSRPYVGHKQLAIFFKGVVRFFAQINMSIVSTSYKNNSTEVMWNAKATCYNGKEISFHGKEVFQVGESGEIFTAQVYWGPRTIADQL